MNAFTTQEYTAFYVRVPDDHLAVAADILSDVVWSPAFRPDEVDSERQVILEEIRMRDDTPDDIVHELFADGAVPEASARPLGARHAARRSPPRRATRSPSTTREHYRPSNVVVAAAGNLEHEQVVELISGRARRRRTATRPAARRPVVRAAGAASSASGARPSRRTSCSACARSPATIRIATRCRS